MFVCEMYSFVEGGNKLGGFQPEGTAQYDQTCWSGNTGPPRRGRNGQVAPATQRLTAATATACLLHTEHGHALVIRGTRQRLVKSRDTSRVATGRHYARQPKALEGRERAHPPRQGARKGVHRIQLKLGETETGAPSSGTGALSIMLQHTVSPNPKRSHRPSPRKGP